jgi:alpha-tubulin suppressor-like RCC1 family protein
MFGTKILIDKLNTAINSGSLTEMEIVQALGAIESLEKHPVSSVKTSAYLPNPVTNKGRFFWIESELKYAFSDGITWGNSSIVRVPYINVWSWGGAASGKLGDNTITNKSSPVSIAGPFTDWIQTSAGGSHSLGLRANGTAWAWGSNNSSQLGDNSLTAASKSSPVSVVGGFADWTRLSAGIQHSIGLRANGTLWAWGINTYGRLGDGTTTNRSSPVAVVGGFADWNSAAAGNVHSLGIRANGTAWAWGANINGRLGDGTTANKSSPVAVVGGFTDWIDLAAGLSQSIGLRANGTIWTWGYNTGGQLGDGTAVSKSSPVAVVGGFADWIQISSTSIHTIALRANGTAWAWGSNTSGRLGDGTTANKSSPVAVVGGFTDWVQVSANVHSLGIRANGTAWAWGSNSSGQLGDGSLTTASKSSPVSIVGGFTDWVQVSCSTDHSVGIRG